MGVVHKGELSSAVEEALGAIESGQVTQPIQVLEGFALFKLLGRLPPVVSAFEEVRERALALYKRRLSQEQRDRFLSALKDKSVVTVGELENATEEAGDSPAQ